MLRASPDASNDTHSHSGAIDRFRATFCVGDVFLRRSFFSNENEGCLSQEECIEEWMRHGGYML